MIAVADQQARWGVSGVERHAVRGVELPWAVTLGPEVFQVFTSLVVLENDVAGVAVGQINVAIGIDRDGRRAETGKLEFGLLGEG